MYKRQKFLGNGGQGRNTSSDDSFGSMWMREFYSIRPVELVVYSNGLVKLRVLSTTHLCFFCGEDC